MTALPGDSEYTLITSDGERLCLDPSRVTHVYDHRDELVGYEYSGPALPEQAESTPKER